MFVSRVFVCLHVPMRKICFSVDWTLLVEEHIANIVRFFVDSMIFVFKILFCFSALCKPSYCAIMGVSKGRVDCTLLVAEHIANIGIPLKLLRFFVDSRNFMF